jgi:hypothetical protein
MKQMGFRTGRRPAEDMSRCEEVYLHSCEFTNIPKILELRCDLAEFVYCNLLTY